MKKVISLTARQEKRYSLQGECYLTLDLYPWRGFVNILIKRATGVLQAGKTFWTELLYKKNCSSTWWNQVCKIILASWQFAQCSALKTLDIQNVLQPLVYFGSVVVGFRRRSVHMCVPPSLPTPSLFICLLLQIICLTHYFHSK